MKQKSKQYEKVKLLSKIEFLLEKRRIIFFTAVISVVVLVLYVVTFNWEPLFFLTVETANMIWNIMLSLFSSYLVSFIFYLLLLFGQEYQEYRRRYAMSYRIYEYFLRLNTYVSCLINMIEAVSSQEKIENDFKFYSHIKNRKLSYDYIFYTTGKSCDWGVCRACREIELNLKKIDTYYAILSKEAIDIFCGLQDTYIFENINNEEFDDAVSSFFNTLKSVSIQLNKVTKNNRFYIVTVD